MRTLPIHDIETRHPALWKEIADFYMLAARFCLDRHYRSPVEFTLSHNGSRSAVRIEWLRTECGIEDAWDDRVATEHGAYLCALAAVELSEGLVAFYRAETGSGADYYVGAPGSIHEDLEDCVRVEVSGVGCGSESDVDARVRKKLKQAALGNSDLPARAAVVGFGAALISIVDLK